MKWLGKWIELEYTILSEYTRTRNTNFELSHSSVVPSSKYSYASKLLGVIAKITCS